MPVWHKNREEGHTCHLSGSPSHGLAVTITIHHSPGRSESCRSKRSYGSQFLCKIKGGDRLQYYGNCRGSFPCQSGILCFVTFSVSSFLFYSLLCG